MKKLTLATIVAAGLIAAATPQAEAIGCLSGGAIGAVGGHLAGHHGLLGAGAGCVAGHYAHKRQMQSRYNSYAQPGRPGSVARGVSDSRASDGR